MDDKMKREFIKALPKPKTESYNGILKAEAPEGFPESDIEIVMNQTSCSREETVKALENNGGDIVNAIMEIVDEKSKCWNKYPE